MLALFTYFVLYVIPFVLSAQRVLELRAGFGNYHLLRLLSTSLILGYSGLRSPYELMTLAAAVCQRVPPLEGRRGSEPRLWTIFDIGPATKPHLLRRQLTLSCDSSLVVELVFSPWTDETHRDSLLDAVLGGQSRIAHLLIAVINWDDSNTEDKHIPSPVDVVEWPERVRVTRALGGDSVWPRLRHLHLEAKESVLLSAVLQISVIAPRLETCIFNTIAINSEWTGIAA